MEMKKIIKKLVESKNKNKGGKMKRKKTIKKFQNRFLTYQKHKKLFKTFAIIAWLLAAGAILTLGGNVVVKDGGLNVTDDFFVSTDVLFVDTTNNKVGVGTTTPNEKLTVVGNVNITQNLTIGDKLTFAFSEFIDNLVDGWLRITGSLNITGDLNVIGNITGSSPVKIKGGLNVLNASGTTHLYVNDTTGYVGVGTTSPSQKLEVNGSIQVINTTSGASLFVVNATTGNVDAQGKIKEYGNDLLPSGVILMWSGTIANIPTGWGLCNGSTYTAPDGSQVSTPDLRNKFIYGVNATEDPGATGGSSTHNHTLENTEVFYGPSRELPGYIDDDGGLTASLEDGSRDIYMAYASGYSKKIAGTSTNYNVTSTRANLCVDPDAAAASTSTLPPYYKLAYIIKL